MKKIVFLSIMVLVFGFASWAGAYTYSVTDKYGIFNNDSSSDAVVDLVLWYGSGNGHYEYSKEGNTWAQITNGGDKQTESFTVGNNEFFYLKFVGGNNDDKRLETYNITNPTYWFAFNQPWDGNGDPTTCVAFIEGSPVPIPGAVWLFGSGLLGLVGIRKRK